MMVKGFKTVKTLNGDVVQEVDGIAIPLQMRVYFDNPITYEGTLRWVIGCVTSQGEMLPCVENTKEISLGAIKNIDFTAIDDEKLNQIKNKTIGELTGENILDIMRVLFLQNMQIETNNQGTNNTEQE